MVGTYKWFWSLQLSHQQLPGPTLTYVVSGALMGLTPLSCILLWLRGGALYLQLWRVVLGHPACPLFFKFIDLKSHFFCLNFYSILTVYQYTMLSKEMSRNSISSWMYLCRKPQYLSTKCHSESLIPNFLWRVWNLLVNSNTSWSLPCSSMVHFMYLSS